MVVKLERATKRKIKEEIKKVEPKEGFVNGATIPDIVVGNTEVKVYVSPALGRRIHRVDVHSKNGSTRFLRLGKRIRPFDMPKVDVIEGMVVTLLNQKKG